MSRRIALMFTLSGAAGLVFEVALQRALARAFGVSAFATSTVLAAYMGGLALGAVLFGLRAERSKNPLRLYAGFELGIAVCAALLPVLAPRLVTAFSSMLEGTPLDSPKLLAARLVIALVVTLVPTVMMGGTLPAVAKALQTQAFDTTTVSRLYTLNLLGASGGAALAAYLLMPTFGLSGTAWIGAALNAAAALIALWVTAPSAAPPAPAPPAAQAPSAAATVDRRGLWAAAFASGLITFMVEVGWFQLLAVVVGTSAYSFGLMLAVFLTGLVLGSAWVSRQPDSKVSYALLGKVQMLAAAVLVVTIPLWDAVPKLFVQAGRSVTSFEGRELVRALACVEVMLLPAVVLGAVYPLVLRLAARTDQVGKAVGQIAAANTLGAVLGALGTGFVLLPLLGSRGVLVAVTLCCCALAVLWLRGRWRLGPAVAAVVVLLLPGWNFARLASGSNVYFAETPYGDSEVVWARESVAGGLTTVVKLPAGYLVLLTNGKFQGSTAGETDAQLAFAQQPLLFVRRWENALLIGIGTGGSLSVVGTAGFKHSVGVDLSRDIVDAAREYFGSVHHGIFDSPNVQVRIADGRNLLLLETTVWDLISIELSSIWFAGAADIYNREFYALAKRRLAPRGVLQQWIQLHHMTRRDAAVILQSVRAELPHVVLFFRGGQGVIVASREPLVLDYPALIETSRRLKGQPAGAGLPADDLLAAAGALELDEAGVAQFIAEEAKKAGVAPEQLVSTDDNLWLEYSTPRANADGSLMASTFLEGIAHLSHQPFAVTGAQTPGQQAHAEAAFWVGRGDFAKASVLLEGPAADEPNAAALRELVRKDLASRPAPP